MHIDSWNLHKLQVSLSFHFVSTVVASCERWLFQMFLMCFVKSFCWDLRHFLTLVKQHKCWQHSEMPSWFPSVGTFSQSCSRPCTQTEEYKSACLIPAVLWVCLKPTWSHLQFHHISLLLSFPLSPPNSSPLPVSLQTPSLWPPSAFHLVLLISPLFCLQMSRCPHVVEVCSLVWRAQYIFMF